MPTQYGEAVLLTIGPPENPTVISADNPLPITGGGGGGGGDATAANQVTGNTSLASINTKTPALGQALAAGSTPVVLPATQWNALTDGTQIAIAKGAAASGAAVSGNPVLVSGSDGTNARSLATDTSGNQLTVGNVAHDAVDSSNPVKIGGRANSSTPPGVSGANRRVDAWFGFNGALATFLTTGAGGASAALGSVAPQDAYNFAGAGLLIVSSQQDYNGSTSDRHRNNHEVTVLASAARTASNNSPDQTNYNSRCLKVVIDITAVAGSPSLVFTIKGKSTLSGKYFTLLASPAITGIGTTVLKIFPGATPAAGATGAGATANAAANDFVPRIWRVEVAVGTADSVTYSVDCQYCE